MQEVASEAEGLPLCGLAPLAVRQCCMWPLQVGLVLVQVGALVGAPMLHMVFGPLQDGLACVWVCALGVC